MLHQFSGKFEALVRVMVLVVFLAEPVSPFNGFRCHHHEIVSLCEPVLRVLPDVRKQESVNDFLRPAQPVILNLPRRHEFADFVQRLFLAFHEKVFNVYHHVILQMHFINEGFPYRLAGFQPQRLEQDKKLQLARRSRKSNIKHAVRVSDDSDPSLERAPRAYDLRNNLVGLLRHNDPVRGKHFLRHQRLFRAVDYEVSAEIFRVFPELEELIQFGEDPKDFGGYFIINGSEKALMTQEVLASDRVIVSEQSDRIVAEVISTRGAFKGRVRIIRRPDGTLGVTFPASPRKLKLFVLLKALGLRTPQAITDAFIDQKEIQNDVMINNENLLVKSEKEALDKIGKFVAPGQVEEYRLRRAQEVIDAFLLPHIGQDAKNRLAKAYYLVMMATKAVERAYNLREQDDKDHYSNKRLELSGKLMEHLFRYSFKYFIKDLKFQIDRTVTRRRKLNISTIVRPGAVSERIRFAMSTGNWIGRATGVSKFMDRVNYLSPLTDLRKVKSPLDKNRELYEARDVHGTHWGRLCAIETPDGPMCVAPETTITLSNGTIIPIKEYENIWKKQRVSSIDWESKQEKEANSVRYLKMQPNKKVLEIKTSQGRSITATIDHPFYSERFEKTELGNLKIGDKIATM